MPRGLRPRRRHDCSQLIFQLKRNFWITKHMKQDICQRLCSCLTSCACQYLTLVGQSIQGFLVIWQNGTVKEIVEDSPCMVLAILLSAFKDRGDYLSHFILPEN